MSAATLEKPARMVSAPEGDRVYLSRRSELVLVIKRDLPKTDREGNVTETIQGQRVSFSDGQLRVPTSGWVTGTRRERIKAEDVRDFLEGNEEKDIAPHLLLGDREGGFWRHVEPAPAPSEDELNRVLELAEDRDVEGLEELVAQERAGWARAELLKVAQGSLERVQRRLVESAPEAPVAPSKAPEGEKAQDFPPSVIAAA
jgi:hypothetical protein